MAYRGDKLVLGLVQTLELPDLQTQFELTDDLPCKRLEGALLLGSNCPGFICDDAQGANLEIILHHQWCTRIEFYVRGPGGQRIVMKSFIQGGILDHKNTVTKNGMRAESDFTGCFACIQAMAGFKPLPVVIDQAHQRNGRVADLCRQIGKVVIGLFFKRIEDIELVLSADTLRFVFR